MKSGLIRWQLPATTWNEQPLSSLLIEPALAEPKAYAEYRRTSAPRFFFDPRDRQKFQPFFAAWDSDEASPMIESENLRTGFVRFFSHELVDVGIPPRWHVDPFTKRSFPTDRHWSQIGDFAAGDIKLVWETNRFGFVFHLVRSYWRTGDEQYARFFWQLVESWFEANPPETGVNWKCGQEISLRAMALCFGLYGFGASAESTPIRVAMLAQILAVSGHRIESNIGYALSQQNNHGLSEAMGLWTIGALFPEFTDSARWASLGRRLLESQALELIYDDGAFSQHSMNYHRVMLHDYAWSIRLGDVLKQPFSTNLRARISRAGEFVYQLQDESTGRVPCYGQDDGALILPLNNCGYQDYRPIVQATHYLATGGRRLESGRWDEDLLWLFGTSAVVDSQPGSADSSQDRVEVTDATIRRDFVAPDGGYATLRNPHGFALTRAAQFQHRPAQADMLHVDIWWHGENIAIDPGTYSYNSPPPWNNRLAHTAHHNTVTVDGEDQMERAGRFLWLPWLNGKSFASNVDHQSDVACWNGEHDGYRRLPDPIIHRRGLVRLGDDHWLVVDSLCGQAPHSFHLHWLLLDAPYELDVETQSIELQTSVGQYRLAVAASDSISRFEVVRAAADSAVGWRSRFYHDREPAISVNVETKATSIVFATVLGPDARQPIIENELVHVHGEDWRVAVSLNSTSGLPLVASIEASGTLLESRLSNLTESQYPIRESHQCTSC